VRGHCGACIATLFAPEIAEFDGKSHKWMIYVSIVVSVDSDV